MVESLERRIRAEIARSDVPRDVVEKDYAIGYVLAGVCAVPDLNSRLVFKGGTALRKAYFKDYRFSEDLDFTALPGSGDLESLMRRAASRAADALQQQGDFEVSMDRFPVRDAHPGGQEAFRFQVRFPWQRRALCSLKVEITMDEPVLAEIMRLPLAHGYDEPLTSIIGCYALDEVVAEKLRALLQTRARLATRGWARPRSRDYYDLWQILCVRRDAVDVAAVARMLPKKCEVRGVSFDGVEDFFDAGVVERARVDWEQGLRRMVAASPDFDRCLSELRQPVSLLVAER